MAFELYENLSSSRDITPYLLNIQHDICALLDTRVIVPVVVSKPNRSSTDFVVPMTIGARTVYAVVSHVAAVPVAILGAPVADCSVYYDVIRGGVDRLFIGY